MKKKVKIIIDMIMIILIIILMGYHITGNQLHEIVGTITFILFIMHHVLNINWYKSLFKGKYNFQRVLYITINILLFIAMIGIIISGIIISASVFSFLNIPTTTFGRKLHMISTSWGFALIAMHIGLHINSMMLKISKKMRNSTFEYVYYFLLILLVGYGIYAFILSEMWKDMFLINEFKFFNYEQSPILFYIENIAIVISIALIIYFVFKTIRKILNKKEVEIPN